MSAITNSAMLHQQVREHPAFQKILTPEERSRMEHELIVVSDEKVEKTLAELDAKLRQT